MKIIADAGATKTAWLIVPAVGWEARKVIYTQGLSPVHQSAEDIRAILIHELLPQLPNEAVDKTCFYGAGCMSSNQNVLFDVWMLGGELQVASDMYGATRMLCGVNDGIVCILGTGSNSCLYIGGEIVANTPPLGYILGDEGSGASIGKRFLNALYKGHLPESLKSAFEKETGFSKDDIIHSVYREPQANRFLAQQTKFVGKYIIEYNELYRLVKNEFCIFVERNLEPYGRRDVEVSAVGSVAWFFRPIFEEVLVEKGYPIGRICQTPLDALNAKTCEEIL